MALNRKIKQNQVNSLTSWENNVSALIEGFYFFLNENLNADKDLIQNEIIKYLATGLRFVPIEKVDKFVGTIEADVEKRKIFKKLYEKAKELFLKMAPYCSRYSNTDDLIALQDSYDRNFDYKNLLSIAKNDLEFALGRYTLTKKILSVLTQSEQKFEPKHADFKNLPKSLTGECKVANILECVSYWNFKKNNGQVDFFQLRRIGYQTPIRGRYSWAMPLIESVCLFSSNIEKDSLRNCYSLCYGGFILTSVYASKQIFEHQRYWRHGLAALDATWSNIEDLFEKIWNMDLNNSHEKIALFYEDATELVWLIGNTQPLNRGSGSIAEIILALIHLRHNLQPPILKLEFPQLDVLDITFPLEDYKYFFPFFFEPSTIPTQLRTRFKDIDTSLPVKDQIKKLYQKLNLGSEDKVNLKTNKKINSFRF